MTEAADYSIQWSDALIGKVNECCKDVYSILSHHYETHHYPLFLNGLNAIPVSNNKNGNRNKNVSDSESGETDEENEEGQNTNSAKKDSGGGGGNKSNAISLVGSFPLRTNCFSSPIQLLNNYEGFGVDMCLSIPAELSTPNSGDNSKNKVCCTRDDLVDGKYFDIRREFLSEIEACLRERIARAQRITNTNNHNNDIDNEEASDNEDGEGEGKGEKGGKVNMHTERRIACISVERIPIHNCYSFKEKEILRLFFRNVNSNVTEIFHLDLHFRPSVNDKRISCPEVIRKLSRRDDINYPFTASEEEMAINNNNNNNNGGHHRRPIKSGVCYVYSILEDYYMPYYTEELHKVCVKSANIRTAMVLLKIWGYHSGILLNKSFREPLNNNNNNGSSEAALLLRSNPQLLSGFAISMMLLSMVEGGVISAQMKVESIVRAFWVHVARGSFTQPQHHHHNNEEGGAKNKKRILPLPEEKGEVCVLRFGNAKSLNLLFRTSVPFFKSFIVPAAENALLYSLSSDFFRATPFKPLEMTADAVFMLRCREDEGLEGDSSANANGIDFNTRATMKGYFPHFLSNTQKLESILCFALADRITREGVQCWRVSPTAVAVLLFFDKRHNNSHNERSRITRGPEISANVKASKDVGSNSDSDDNGSSDDDDDNNNNAGKKVKTNVNNKDMERFEWFWGKENISLRQFSDGAIHKCLLWNDDENSHILFQRPKSDDVDDNQQTLMLNSVLPSPIKIARQIISLALERHFFSSDVKSNNTNNSSSPRISVWLGGLDDFLKERVGHEYVDSFAISTSLLPQAVKRMENIIFHRLKRQNGDDESLSFPFKIESFDIISESERRTEVFPARPHISLLNLAAGKNNNNINLSGLDTNACIAPIYCVLSISDERNKIPDNLEAIKVMKSAIAAQLSTIINHYYPLSKSSKSQDTVTAFVSNLNSVDVVINGFLFRVFVSIYREISLLRALQKENEANFYEVNFYYKALHGKFIKTYSTGNEIYTTAVRLAKRFLSCHLLYEFFAPEAVELLVLYPFLCESTSIEHASNSSNSGGVFDHMRAPQTVASAFYYFLLLVSSFDWEKSALVFPYTFSSGEADAENSEEGGHHRGKGKLSAANKERLDKIIQQSKKDSGSHPHNNGMVILTPYSPKLSPFTLNTPRKLILHKLKQICESALTHYFLFPFINSIEDYYMNRYVPLFSSENSGAPRAIHSNNNNNNFSSLEVFLFSNNIASYDFIMPLHPSIITHPDRLIFPPTAYTDGGHGINNNNNNNNVGMDNSVNSTRVSEGGGAEGGQHHSSSGHYGSAAHSEGVMHTMKRVYTFNELVARHLSAKASDSKSSNNSNNTNIIKTYIASLTDRNPSTELLKMLRVKTREKAMLFTDVLAPQHLYVCLLPSSDRGSVFDSNFVVESHRKFRYFHPLSVPTHTNKWRLLVKDEIPTREEALALHRSLLISGKGAVLPADSNNFCPLVLNNTTQQQQHQQQQQQEFEEHSKKKNSNSSKRVESARKRPRSEERKVSPQQSSTSNNDTTNKKEKMKSNKRAREEAAPSKKSAKKAKTEKSKK